MEKKYSFIIEDDIPIVVPKRMMIFAGHPDDEIISCGGTLLKYKEYGTEITIIVATMGLGGYSKVSQKAKVSNQRKEELELISKQLNSRIIELNFDSLPVDREKIAIITNLIRDSQPQVILLPHYSDFHRIHRNLSLITREAIYHCSTGKAYGGSGRNWIPLGVYYYETPSCKFQYIDASVFVIVDIEKYWGTKKAIFNDVYKSQKEVLERVLEWAEDTAVLRGNEINSQYGEAYIPDTTYTPLRVLLV